MSNAYFIIGALIVVALIAVVLIRKSKAKNTQPTSEPVTTPPADVQPIPPVIAESPFILEPSTTPAEPASATRVEVRNQTDFRVVVIQQELRMTLPAQGRMQMDGDLPLTAVPEAPSDAPHGVSIEPGDTPNSLIIRAIDK